MKGRDRSGVDASGTIGDIELIEKDEKSSNISHVHTVRGVLPRKAMGFGLLFVFIGFCMWLWPKLYLYVMLPLSFMDKGIQFIGWGVMIMVAALLFKIVVNPILDIILR